MRCAGSHPGGPRSSDAATTSTAAWTARASSRVQFYSGVFLDSTTSGKGRTHVPYGGLCLETQAFPNAINVPAWRDHVILEPGQTYRHETVYGFSAG